MSDYNDIITINITRQDTPVKITNFGIPLILGAHKVFIERARVYFNLSDMLTDGFLSTDSEYLAALAIYSQNPTVQEIVVGRRSVDKVLISVVTALDNTDYYTTIDGTQFLINSGVGATTISIAADLVAAINLGVEPVTAVDILDGTYELDADVATTAYTIAVDADQLITKPYSPSALVTDDLEAIKAENEDWYLIIETLHDPAEVLEIAAWVEAEKKLYITASSDANIIDQDVITDTTSIAALLHAAEYDRTAVIYYDDLLKFVEAGWAGVELTKDAGTSTWAHKTIIGIPALNLNGTKIKNATDKKANVYVITGADGRTRWGTVASGEYIDIMRGADWLKARLQEALYSLLISADKVPYTDSGIASVRSFMNVVLREAVAIDYITEDYTIIVPRAKDISSADKIARILKNVTFKAPLAGAIHKIEINGTLVL